MKIRVLDTTDEVIDECGGTVAFAKLIARDKQHVSNYRSTGRFPPDTFLIVEAALKKRRCRAPSMLWSITDPAKMARAV